MTLVQVYIERGCQRQAYEKDKCKGYDTILVFQLPLTAFLKSHHFPDVI